MKITLESFGGLAAGIARRPTQIDSSALPAASAKELEQLVAAASSEAPVADPRRGMGGDVMSYAITIEADSGTVTELRATNTAMPPHFLDLKRWIARHAAKAR